MAFSTVVVQSEEIDSERALKEILTKGMDQLKGSKPLVGIIFMGIDHQHQRFADGICDQWPEIFLIGCTTDGEFSSDIGYREDSVVLTMILSDTRRAYAGYINNFGTSVDEEAEYLYREAVACLGHRPKLSILFSEALKINGEKILDSITRVTHGELPIVGGISADSVRNEETIQICGRKVSSEISPILFLSGDFDFSWGMESGWEPFGDIGIITKSKENQLFEINHKPALEFYYETLGEGMKPTNEMPIAIYDENGSFRFLRTSLENCDLDTGSITYFGNIPEAGTVRIAMVNREDILKGANKSVTQALDSFPKDKKPVLMLGFSCSARRALLGTRTREEFDAIRNLADREIAIAGFFTYGEICPSRSHKQCEFHNETFVTVLLG